MAVHPWKRDFSTVFAKAHAAKTSHVFHLREGKVVDLPDFTRRTSLAVSMSKDHMSWWFLQP